MAPVYVAILWHQHQPYYADDVADEVEMAWVRLHGAKDYWGMAKHLEQHPEVRCTINLVPSLIVQLLDYAEHGREDRLLRLCRMPADSLSEDEAIYLLEHGFLGHLDHMIRPHPRYYELWRLRGMGVDKPERALKRFRARDLRDLQVWANLAWIHPLAAEEDPHLEELRRKERHYTEEEKLWILEKQLELIREVLPLHRKLAERGQVELITSPFFHPILPLLIDKRLAQVALPDLKLPSYVGGYPEDAEWHVREAVKLYQEVFGTKPRGMWPSEGSVCEAMVPLLARYGLKWMASDEDILSRTLEGRIARDALGYVRNPHLLYRPWKIRWGGAELDMVFRDHALSDLISFHYRQLDPRTAVEDLLSKVQAIGRAVRSEQPPLVCIILDGENPWEFYSGGGVPFLRQLYGELERSQQVRTTTISDFLAQFPPAEALTKLFPGSWINSNFSIWIGHEEDRQAWDLLHETREFLVAAERNGVASGEAIQRAWREIYIAEGSDWFWWYGDEHHSAQEELFDYLFRKHLQNVYTLLGQQVPARLAHPIHVERRTASCSQPTALLEVKVDGRYTFFEWSGAGLYVANGERSTMARATVGVGRSVRFGFSQSHLFIRLDTVEPAREALRSVDVVRIGFLSPPGLTIEISGFRMGDIQVKLLCKGVPAKRKEAVAVAVDRILEVGVPLKLLNVAPESPISFFLELFRGPTSIDRLPRDGAIETTAPSEDFEAAMWIV